MSEQRVRNVRELREYLNALEAKWTDQDREVLGEFDLMAVLVPYGSLDVPNGVGDAYATCDVSLGIVIDQPHYS